MAAAPLPPGYSHKMSRSKSFQSVSLEINDQVFTLSPVDDKVMFSVKKVKGKSTTHELFADNCYEDWAPRHIFNNILNFYTPAKWSIVLILKYGVELRREFSVEQQAKDIYLKNTSHCEMTGIDKDSDSYCEIVSNAEPDCLWDDSLLSIHIQFNILEYMLRKNREEKKFSKVLEGKECPVLPDTKLTTKNGVVLNCDHCLSWEAWQKQNGVLCPLCRHPHDGKGCVKYRPSFDASD